MVKVDNYILHIIKIKFSHIYINDCPKPTHRCELTFHSIIGFVTPLTAGIDDKLKASHNATVMSQ